MVMHQQEAERLLPDEISSTTVGGRAAWALLMVDVGDHAQVWLCGRARRQKRRALCGTPYIVELTAVRRVDAVPRGARHDGGGVLPNSLVFRAAKVFGVDRYHGRGQDVRSIGGIGYATITNEPFLFAGVDELGGAWRAAQRLGIPARKIKDALDG